MTGSFTTKEIGEVEERENGEKKKKGGTKIVCVIDAPAR